MRLVSLPWYDTPLARVELDVFWSDVRSLLEPQLSDLPQTLERSMPLQKQWIHPELLLSQCCGPDLFGRAAGLEPFARPVFDLDCEPGSYLSYVVTPERSKSTLPVINAPSSRSGCGALLAWLAARGQTPNTLLVSGSHQQSVELLRRGHAGIAAIDAQSWKVIDHSGLVVVGKTDAAPAPPYVTPRGGDVSSEILFEALETALSCGADIGISGLMDADVELYRPLQKDLSQFHYVTASSLEEAVG